MARGISGDGTFLITPTHWRQVFIISAEIDKGMFVPCVFALLPSKEKEVYDELFDVLKKALHVTEARLIPRINRNFIFF